VAGAVHVVGLRVGLSLDRNQIENWGHNAQFGSHVLLALPVFGSIVVGHAFTKEYARVATPSPSWSMPDTCVVTASHYCG
jgi:hypothetical protein